MPDSIARSAGATWSTQLDARAVGGRLSQANAARDQRLRVSHVGPDGPRHSLMYLVSALSGATILRYLEVCDCRPRKLRGCAASLRPPLDGGL